ncbi:MAG: WD40 repeat protein [Pirellulaceae bacterium]|jgi:WD40 repeat protein
MKTMFRWTAVIGLVLTLILPGSLSANEQASVVRGSWRSRTIEVEGLQDGEKAPVVSTVKLHPSGRIMASAGDDHLVRIWDLREATVIHKLTGHTDWVRALSFSPDGNLLASGGNDRHIRVWNVETGRKLEIDLVHPQAIAGILFNKTGDELVVIGFEKTARVYSTTEWKLLREIGCPCQDMRAISLSPDGKIMAAGGRNGIIRWWTTDMDNILLDRAAHRQRVRSVAFSSDSKWFASAGEDGRVVLRSTTNPESTATLPRVTAKIFSIAFIESAFLATAGSDDLIRIWDINSREEVARLNGHLGTIVSLDYQNGVLVSGSYDTTIRVWDQRDATALEAETGPRIGNARIGIIK